MTKTIYCDNMKEYIEKIEDQRFNGKNEGWNIKYQPKKKLGRPRKNE